MYFLLVAAVVAFLVLRRVRWPAYALVAVAVVLLRVATDPAVLSALPERWPHALDIVLGTAVVLAAFAVFVLHPLHLGGVFLRLTLRNPDDQSRKINIGTLAIVAVVLVIAWLADQLMIRW